MLITEGFSEYKSMPQMFSQLKSRTSHTILGPLKMNMSPDAPTPAMVRESLKYLLLASLQRADLAVILLDREQQQNLSGNIASNIESALAQRNVLGIQVRVVLKDRCFENWLVADLDALRKQPARFNITRSMENKIVPNKADSCDATGILKTSTGNTYDKTSDSEKICAHFNVAKAAKNSRSFRHFLHALEDPKYTPNCKLP